MTVKPDQEQAQETRANSRTYNTKITIACDTSKMRYDHDTGVAQIHGDATLPPRLARYAEASGHAMPEGLYGFFGEQASANLKTEVMAHLNGREKGDGFLWDLQSSLEFNCETSAPKTATSLVWKDPAYLQAAFIRVGKPSKDVADFLRYFTGDRHALDRLTLEPWRIDTYAAALAEAYGPMRAVVFDAMVDDGSIVPMIRVYDPTLINGGVVEPLYQFLSAKDPEQPSEYHIPDAGWSGWGVHEKTLHPLDRADIIAFQNVPRTHRRERDALTMRRIRALRQEGRFNPREADLKEIVNRRLEGTRANSPASAQRERRERVAAPLPLAGVGAGAPLRSDLTII